MRSHIERMSDLENGRFLDDALERAGRSASRPVDMTRFPDFAEVARFFRIEAATGLPGASRPKSTEFNDFDQAAIPASIYRAILERAARGYQQPPRAGEARVDVRLVFDPHLAERLAAWSIRWARALVDADLTRVAKFNAVRSHVERMASLEDGRALRDAFEQAGPHVVAVDAPAPPREFADVARFFRLEGMWELAQTRSR
jgi:hypothetical protein